MSARPDAARVAALFDELADLDPGEAARRLTAAAGGDAALKAEVERLLAHDRAASASFLARPAAALAEAQQALAREAPEPGSAARIGHFVLLRKLGEGGMGVVHVGYDEALDRRVAIKVLRRGAGAGEWLTREGQALGRLAHPHVVGVHEIGVHEGRVFLAMELVEGPTLRKWLAERERPFNEVAAMFVQAGRGLAAAHAAGLVHRDFKPDNVLVGADGRARVLDFGIAALAGTSVPQPAAEPHHASALESPLTQTGALMGTPAFMAPEQVRSERATPQSDQWAFCVALYQAAYGAQPFHSDDLLDLLRSIRDDPPAPPPRHPETPAWLWRILERGLAKDPAARFPSMDALLEEIVRHLPRDPDLDPAAVRRERAIMAGLLCLAALAISAFISVRGSDRAISGPQDLVRLAAVLCGGTVAAAALLRRRLIKNLYGRRMTALLLISFFALLAHRLAAVRLDMPVPHVLVGDQIILAALLAGPALTMERWMGWVSAMLLAGAAVSVAQPAWAVPSFSLSTLAMTALCVVMWGRRA